MSRDNLRKLKTYDNPSWLTKSTKIMNKNFQKLVNGFMEVAATLSHIQKDGMASYDNNRIFTFMPDDVEARDIFPYRSPGTAQLMSNGTFIFVRKPRLRSQSKLIKKLPHGRVSETKDGAVQLTIKIYEDEDVDIVDTIGKEASEAKKAVKEWLIK